MKLHINEFWHHDEAAHQDFLAPTHSHNFLYLVILLVGVPATVGATMFVVRYLYDGVMWLLPT